MRDHELDDIEDMQRDGSYLRAKRYDAGLFIEAKEVDDGVVVIRCEKKSS